MNLDHIRFLSSQNGKFNNTSVRLNCFHTKKEIQCWILRTAIIRDEFIYRNITIQLDPLSVNLYPFKNEKGIVKTIVTVFENFQ